MPTPDFSKVWASNSPLPEYTFSDADYLTGWDFVGSAPPTKNEFDAWFKLVDTKLNWLYSQLQDTASKLYPVGSVYISFNATDPSTLFGGTWARLKDTFLLANGNTYPANSTGGSATKTISTSNLPSHSHTCSTDGIHSHGPGSMEITGQLVMETGGATSYFTGAFRVGSATSTTLSAPGGTGDTRVSFQASRSWTGRTEQYGDHAHTIGSTGSGLPLNIMPPYTTVYAWRRTA